LPTNPQRASLVWDVVSSGIVERSGNARPALAQVGLARAQRSQVRRCLLWADLEDAPSVFGRLPIWPLTKAWP